LDVRPSYVIQRAALVKVVTYVLAQQASWVGHSRVRYFKAGFCM